MKLKRIISAALLLVVALLIWQFGFKEAFKIIYITALSVVCAAILFILYCAAQDWDANENQSRH